MGITSKKTRGFSFRTHEEWYPKLSTQNKLKRECDMEIALAVVGALLAVSEGLSLIPQVKANGIFQAIVNTLKTVKDFLTKK